MLLRLTYLGFRLMDKSKEGGGGGGGGEGDGKKDSGLNSEKEIADLKAMNATLESRLAKLEGKKPGEKESDDDKEKSLVDKAREQRERESKSSGDSKLLEDALKFNLTSADFVKQNKTLLPTDAEEILKAAEKEKYDTAPEKANAIRSSIVQSFFKVQENHDLLTPSQKTSLENYLKLTKAGKEEKASEIYYQIFEPSLEMLRQVRKAQALSKGHGTSSAVDDGYKERLIKGSKKHYLGEKSDA